MSNHESKEKFIEYKDHGGTSTYERFLEARIDICQMESYEYIETYKNMEIVLINLYKSNTVDNFTAHSCVVEAWELGKILSEEKS